MTFVYFHHKFDGSTCPLYAIVVFSIVVLYLKICSAFLVSVDLYFMANI